MTCPSCDAIPKFSGTTKRPKRPRIIDAGANIGASAIWFARTYPKAMVTAIEPHGGNFDLLIKNTIALNVENVYGAVAAKSGKIRLFDPGEGEWGYRTGGSGPGLARCKLIPWKS